MSTSPSHADEVHTGPIKNPKQLLWTVLAAFVIPIFVIIGLVLFVSSAFKPSGTNQAASMGMGGVTEEARDRAQAERLQKVGTVDIRDANRPLATGEAVYKAQCSACHAAGVAGAPKFQDAAAWGPRIKQGYDTLLHSALKGKGAMAAQGGGDFSDVEIGRAVVYVANAAGGNLPEPQAAAPAAAASGADATATPTAAAPVPAAAPAAQASAAPATPPATTLAATIPGAENKPAAPSAGAAPAAAAAVAAVAPAAAPSANAAAGEALYKSTCFVCHAAGVAGAPKFGDKEAWAPRIAAGMDEVMKIVKNGKGAMPPRGGSTASDADLQAAVDYMIGAAK